MAKIAPKEGRGAQSNMIGSSENKWVYQPSFLRRHAPDQQAAKDQKHQHRRGLFTGEQENQDLCHSLLALFVSCLAVSKLVSIHPRRAVSPPALEAPNRRRVSYPADRIQTFHISFLN